NTYSGASAAGSHRTGLWGSSIMKILLALILSATSNVASAGDLEVRIRPQLPDSVVTIRDAITYYAEPAGYQFVDHTPVSGDARLVAAQPALRPTKSAPITT